jgi:hypothetical protein
MINFFQLSVTISTFGHNFNLRRYNEVRAAMEGKLSGVQDEVRRCRLTLSNSVLKAARSYAFSA